MPFENPVLIFGGSRRSQCQLSQRREAFQVLVSRGQAFGVSRGEARGKEQQE